MLHYVQYDKIVYIRNALGWVGLALMENFLVYLGA